jgi:hypothetical protein
MAQSMIKDTLGAVAQIVQFYGHSDPRVDEYLNYTPAVNYLALPTFTPCAAATFYRCQDPVRRSSSPSKTSNSTPPIKRSIAFHMQCWRATQSLLPSFNSLKTRTHVKANRLANHDHGKHDGSFYPIYGICSQQRAPQLRPRI